MISETHQSFPTSSLSRSSRPSSVVSSKTKAPRFQLLTRKSMKLKKLSKRIRDPSAETRNTERRIILARSTMVARNTKVKRITRKMNNTIRTRRMSTTRKEKTMLGMSKSPATEKCQAVLLTTSASLFLTTAQSTDKTSRRDSSLHTQRRIHSTRVPSAGCLTTRIRS